MLNIDNETIAKLRDRLKERGERPSLFATDLAALGQSDVPADIILRFDALAEAMFLMAMADGTIDATEEDTLRGALRELSEGTVRSAHIASMLDKAKQRLATEGAEKRLAAVAEALRADRGTAEAAFVLAAAIAFADDEIADAENDLLNELAEALDIDGDQAEALLDEHGIGGAAEE
jgi:tellurite resistance protein